MSDDIKLVAEEQDHQAVAEEMAESIAKMYVDKEKKADAGLNNLINELRVMSEKYRTANGVMAALGCVRDVFGEQAKELTLVEELKIAGKTANDMYKTAELLAKNAEMLEPDDIDLMYFCDPVYDSEFSSIEEPDPLEFVTELMRLQLCQRIGPMASDIYEFCQRADTEIGNARANLMEYCDVNGIDFDKLCNEGEQDG